MTCIDGRASYEFIDSEQIGSRYAFKCHREKTDTEEVIYPVNAVAFHPMYETRHRTHARLPLAAVTAGKSVPGRFGTFATGGCDGYVNFWDGDNRKRLFQVGGIARHQSPSPRAPTPPPQPLRLC